MKSAFMTLLNLAVKLAAATQSYRLLDAGGGRSLEGGRLGSATAHPPGLPSPALQAPSYAAHSCAPHSALAAEPLRAQNEAAVRP